LKKNYSLTVAIICLLGFFLTLFLLWKLELLSNNEDIYALMLNFITIPFNLFIGIFVIRKSLNNSNKKFLIQFFGSMIGRLFFLLAYIVVSLVVLKLPVSSFIFSFFGFYFFCLIFEISYLSSYIKINLKQI